MSRGNTTIGYNSSAYTTGARNTVTGAWASYYSTSGGDNTVAGYFALFYNTSGYKNTAMGSFTLYKNDTGFQNAAFGYSALFSNTSGYRNTAVGGSYTLGRNTIGIENAAFGNKAGQNWTTGNYNIAIGAGANGVTAESGAIRIGGQDKQTKTFIEGIHGASSVGKNTFDEAVCTDSAEQLGPCSPSSIRFKEAVEAMGDTAVKIGALRPVTFLFKRDEADEGPRQYGLIAEEVAKLFPTLVSYDEGGRPATVRYGMLTPLLLNELQRQEAELARLRVRLRQIEALVGTPGQVSTVED